MNARKKTGQVGLAGDGDRAARLALVCPDYTTTPPKIKIVADVAAVARNKAGRAARAGQHELANRHLVLYDALLGRIGRHELARRHLMLYDTLLRRGRGRKWR